MIRNLIISISIFVMTGCATVGSDAINLMSKEELAVLETIRGYSYQTRIEDITRDFGAPVKGAATARPAWEIINNSKPTRLHAYYITGHLNKIHYLSLKPAWGYVIHYNSDGTRTEIQ